MGELNIRPARREEAALVLEFIRELAVYEKLAAEAVASLADIELALFGETPRAYCDIAWQGEQSLGFALWFYNFSTFHGRAGIWLEDLFVRPEHRGKGAGKALLVHLAKRCLNEGLRRLDWAVLDWNAPTIAFYDSLGALALDGWTTRRMTGAALERLASN
jgi:GNAT superfamily N-acetyltransferase